MKRRLDVGNVALSLAAPVASLAVAVGLSALLLLISGFNPGDVLSTLWSRAGLASTWLDAAQRAIPLYLSAIAVAVGFKMGLFNIGVEGQYRVAMLATAVVGAAVRLPAVLHVGFCLMVAMIFGAAWATVPAVLKVTRGVNEVISTIMMNFIAIGLTAFLFAEVFKNTPDGDLNAKTRPMPPSSYMPNLIEQDLRALSGFLIVAIVLGIGFYLMVWRSRFGFQLRASGANPAAARIAGINPKAMIMKAMLLSGALAGLVGMPQILGERHAYGNDLQLNLGFDGIAVALLGRNNPAGMAVGALIFGFLNAAGRFLDLADIPKEIVIILQGVIVLTVVIIYELVGRVRARRTQEIAARDLEVPAVELVAA